MQTTGLPYSETSKITTVKNPQGGGGVTGGLRLPVVHSGYEQQKDTGGIPAPRMRQVTFATD